LSDFDEALRYLDTFVNYEKRPPTGLAPREFGLERVRELLRALGSPHAGLRCLHVAGTKGKGSTSAMAASILSAAGYRTGLYTSPHLVDVRERIRLDGETISREDFARLLEMTRPHLERARAEWVRSAPGSVRRTTYFEILTHLAFLHFKRAGADAAVLEVGLGGRLDATNVIEHPLACAITSVGYDHTAVLGTRLAQIAREKAGIFKPGCPAVVSCHRPSARKATLAAAREMRSPVWLFGREVLLRHGPRGRFSVSTPGGAHENLEIPLWGKHQRENAAVAVALAELARAAGLDRVRPEAVREGLARVSWPGRVQKVADSPVTILDGAHNAESVRALMATLNERLPRRRPVFVLGAMADKPWRRMLRELAPGARALVATSSGNPRACDPAELGRLAARAGVARAEAEPEPKRALARAREIAGRRGLVVVTGSLYLVGMLIPLFEPEEQRSAAGAEAKRARRTSGAVG
jgi:dihydrofolate synthase/folylpolyglutamate synthase